MAGGAATRLGAEVPKGAFQMGLEGFSCLFEVLLNKCAELFHPKVYVMLSNATASTVQFLEDNSYFSYPRQQVEFVFQPEYPVISQTKQLLLDEQRNVQTSPNGNGGFLKAISNSTRNEEYLHVIGVDNPFVKPLDPAMLGFMHANNLNVVNRVLRPNVGEKVGICGMRRIEASVQAPLSQSEVS